MSSFDRRTLLLMPLALAACGFTPVYAPGQNGDLLRGQVEVQELSTSDGYLLVQNLEERLGRGGQPAYELDLDLRLQAQGQAVTASNETTRYSLVGQVDYRLRKAGTEIVVAEGTVDNFTGYSATGSTVDTLSAERDARARLMTIMADQITTELYTTADLSA